MAGQASVRSGELLLLLLLIITVITIITIIIHYCIELLLLPGMMVFTFIAAVNAVVYTIKHMSHHNTSVIATREERISTRVDHCNTATYNNASMSAPTYDLILCWSHYAVHSVCPSVRPSYCN